MQNTAKPEVRAKRGELQISNTLLSLVVALALAILAGGLGYLFAAGQ